MKLDSTFVVVQPDLSIYDELDRRFGGFKARVLL